MSIEHCAGPFPNTAIRSLTPVLFKASRSSITTATNRMSYVPIITERTQDSRNRVPIPDPNVRPTVKTDLVCIQEQPQFGFGRKPPAFRTCIGCEVIVRCQDWPMLCNIELNRSVYREHL